MKKLLLTCIVSVIMQSAVYAQINTTDTQSAAKFMVYYNHGKADSLHILLADQVKPQLPLTTMAATVQQLKANLGNITHVEYLSTAQSVNIYLATFERSGPVLYINFDKGNKVVGFFVDVDKREKVGAVTIPTTNAVIKGTLSVPEVAEPMPVVLLIAGSGPTDRDGNSQLMSGKANNFMQISDGLKLKNIAVLRYDKRGVGQSTTTKAAADVTFEDMVDDAANIIKMLKADKRFNKIIVAGHSEGSLIGMLAAAREKADALISLSGPAFAADAILKTQLKGAVSPDDFAKSTAIIDSIKAGSTVKQKIDPKYNSLFNPSLQPYLYSWMKHDPGKVIATMTIPVLIVQGTNDIQVSVNDASSLKKAYPKAQLKLINGMNHILKQAPADRLQNIATYTNPDLPLHPELIPTLENFIESIAN
ncbi:MAG: alpha/beta fold hydrolase [Sphingobacteriaceae bacterium]|nr:MAG: alpha/beta fold hydrolase [Sphingobacteriaceae bacterium]